MGLFRRNVTGQSGLTPSGLAVDLNLPHVVVEQRWGPDAYARRFSVINQLFSNPASPSSDGIGVRPAPPGSGSERTAREGPMPQSQNFRGYPQAIIDPTSKTLRTVAHFPSTSVAVDPILFAMSAQSPGVV